MFCLGWGPAEEGTAAMTRRKSEDPQCLSQHAPERQGRLKPWVSSAVIKGIQHPQQCKNVERWDPNNRHHLIQIPASKVINIWMICQPWIKKKGRNRCCSYRSKQQQTPNLFFFFSFDREPQLLSSKLVKLPAGRKFREITSHHFIALKLAFTGNKHVKRRDNSWRGVKKL